MNSLKSIVLGIALTLSTITIAEKQTTSSSDLSIAPYSNTDYYVVSLDATIQNTLLSIKDSRGEVYYKLWINDSCAAQKLLDFSLLADGAYFISLYSKGQEEIKQGFVVHDHKIMNSETQGHSVL